MLQAKVIEMAQSLKKKKKKKRKEKRKKQTANSLVFPKRTEKLKGGVVKREANTTSLSRESAEI